MTPTDIKLIQSRNVLRIIYSNQEQHELSAEYLRVHSPSAEVRGHGAAEPKLVFGKAGVRMRSINPVGHYALKITFDDGHDTGLYTWQYLYELGRDFPENWQAYIERLEREGKAREPKAISGPFTELK